MSALSCFPQGTQCTSIDLEDALLHLNSGMSRPAPPPPQRSAAAERLPLSWAPPAVKWQCLLDYMTSLETLIRRRYLHMRPVQFMLHDHDLSRPLYSHAAQLLLWANTHNISILPQHISGKLNVIGDCLSHQHQVLNSVWTLSLQVLFKYGSYGDNPAWTCSPPPTMHICLRSSLHFWTPGHGGSMPCPSHGWGFGVIGFHLQEVTLKALAPFVGPDLSINANNCLVCAVKVYLSRTKDFHHGRKHLSFYKLDLRGEIKAPTVSLWLVKTICYIYEHYAGPDCTSL